MPELQPHAIRASWEADGGDARDEFGAARSRTGRAGSFDLDGVTATLADAADDMQGVLDVVRAVLTEHHEGMEACITDFETSDGNSAGSFHALRR